MKYLVIILIFFPITMYSDISKIAIYPSQIKVSFKYNQIIPMKNESSGISQKRKKQKKKVTQQNSPSTTNSNASECIVVNKFIRLINGMTLANNHKMALIFFDEKDSALEVHTVDNTPKPSPHQIFFIDKSFGRHFQGKLDLYRIPNNASYFMIGIVDAKNRFLQIAKHSHFQDGKIFIADYNKIAPTRKIMLQIELLGSINAISTRACGFSCS